MGDGVADGTIEVTIDRDLCEGHALCAELAPEVFEIGDDDLATWSEPVPADQANAVRAAVNSCPRQALGMRL